VTSSIKPRQARCRRAKLNPCNTSTDAIHGTAAVEPSTAQRRAPAQAATATPAGSPIRASRGGPTSRKTSTSAATDSDQSRPAAPAPIPDWRHRIIAKPSCIACAPITRAAAATVRRNRGSLIRLERPRHGDPAMGPTSWDVGTDRAAADAARNRTPLAITGADRPLTSMSQPPATVAAMKAAEPAARTQPYWKTVPPRAAARTRASERGAGAAVPTP